MLFNQKNITAQFSPTLNTAPPKHEILLQECNNAGFEDGNFGNWETYVGNVTPTTGGIDLSSFSQVLDPTQYKIINTNNIDFYGNFLTGQCGNNAAKIGDILGGYKSSIVKYTFTVNPANVNFSFRYAMVLDDPSSHTQNQKPFFQYTIIKGAANNFIPSNIILSKKFAADRNNPFFTYTANGIVYKDWSTECVNLSAYMGQQVSIYFVVADCAKGGHGGYAYVDCLCENNNAIANMNINTEFCLGEQILMDASASVNEDSYFVSIAESDAFWNPVPGTEVNQWFVAQQASIIDVSALANQLGFQFKCNTYYRIGLAVSNNCVPWNATGQLIYIRCPENVGLGDDITMCCDNIHSVLLGHEQVTPINTFLWSSNPPWLVTTPTAPSIVIDPHQSATVNVTVTDNYGCTLEDEIDIIIEQDFNVTLHYEELGCCSRLIIPEVTLTNCANIFEEDPAWQLKKLQQLNYLWSDGSTDVEHQVSPNQNTTYSLTVSNDCYSHTMSITVPKTPNGNFPTLIAPNAFIPSSNNPQTNKLIIREFGITAPFDGQPAYNAKEYKLDIYDRWGHVIRTVQGGGCNVLQGSIQWDGKNNNGNLVPLGVYIWKLYFKNCTHPNWQPACFNYDNTNSVGLCNSYCVKWWPFPPHNECCDQWSDPCAYRVTVIQ